MTIRISDRGEDDNSGYYKCDLIKGRTVMFCMPPMKDAKTGRPIDLSGPEVDFLAESDGCTTPGQALEVFGRAYDSVLARSAWKDLGGDCDESDNR